MDKQQQDLPSLRLQPPSPTLHPVSTPTSSAHRRIAIAVDLSDESAYAVRWAVSNYLRPGDAVILLHVRPTSVLYGADWGSIRIQLQKDRSKSSRNTEDENDKCEKLDDESENSKKLEDEFDNFTTTKANEVARPLVEAGVPYKVHIVKDHDMKERLCLEVERLGLSAVIMGSRGFGAARRNGKGRLGSVSDYCVHHCVCPVIVVRDDGDGENGARKGSGDTGELELNTVPEEEEEAAAEEYHDASDNEQKASN